MNMRKLFDDYTNHKKQIMIVKSELEHIKNSPIVKTTSYGEELIGGNSDSTDKVIERMKRIEELELEIWELESKTVRIDKALDVIMMEHPYDFKLLKLYHIDKRIYAYIEAKEHIGNTSLKKRLRRMEELVKMLVNAPTK